MNAMYISVYMAFLVHVTPVWSALSVLPYYTGHCPLAHVVLQVSVASSQDGWCFSFTIWCSRTKQPCLRCTLDLPILSGHACTGYYTGMIYAGLFPAQRCIALSRPLASPTHASPALDFPAFPLSGTVGPRFLTPSLCVLWLGFGRICL